MYSRLNNSGQTFFYSGPQYTVRLLLNNIQSHNETLNLKPFSHFTLACTAEDNSSEILKALNQLTHQLEDNHIFKALEVVNMGDEIKPLWSVKLDLGVNESNLRQLLSGYFDALMCAEKNGIRYFWNPIGTQEKKCPHVTLGPTQEDCELANKLVKSNCNFVFNQMDYKKVGPHDPIISIPISYKNDHNLIF